MWIRWTIVYSLLLLLSNEIIAGGVGKAWRVSQYPESNYPSNRPSWTRYDSPSPFEVRTVSGVGYLGPFDDRIQGKHHGKPSKMDWEDPDVTKNGQDLVSVNKSKKDQRLDQDSRRPDPVDQVLDRQDNGIVDDIPDTTTQRIFKTKLMMRVVARGKEDPSIEQERSKEPEKLISRTRRDVENATGMEKIATTKTVREARLTPSAEGWSSQPIAVEFRHRGNLDEIVRQEQSNDNVDEAAMNSRAYYAPRAEFITSHHRRSYPEYRESRAMPINGRTHEDYEAPLTWYRNAIRDRDYDHAASYRYGYNYRYPDRYRTERDYYARLPSEPSYYYDRYRVEDDFDLYGRNRPTPKPKRIVYYATLPEIVRKPVDLRNYPRPYDDRSSPMRGDGTYKRIPGNVDPGRYRYRQLYDGYDSYAKRSSIYDRPYATYQEDEQQQGHGKGAEAKEDSRNDDFSGNHHDRKLDNRMSVREEGKLPWPVQIGTEVNVKDDERIPGRKIFGETSGYERFQNAQLQKAPDATGSSELRDDD